MPTFRDMVYGVYGAWRLARLDTTGMGYFDQTVEGFWKSFFAAAIVAPGYALVVLLELGRQDTDAGALRTLLVHASAYAIGWTAFPLAMHHICGAIGKPGAYIGFIVAFNWAKVIQMTVYLPVILLGASGALPTGLASLLTTIVFFLILAYEWFIARTALGLAGAAAAAIVGLDILIDLILNGTAIAMLG